MQIKNVVPFLITVMILIIFCIKMSDIELSIFKYSLNVEATGLCPVRHDGYTQYQFVLYKKLIITQCMIISPSYQLVSQRVRNICVRIYRAVLSKAVFSYKIIFISLSPQAC